MTNNTLLPVSAIIMTYNEEANINDCLESLFTWVSDIIIIDSYSTDNTLEIASRFTNRIFQNPWKNYSSQYIWAMENTCIQNEWVLRIDADERWTEKGFHELSEIIKKDEFDGVYVKMKMFFMHRWMKYGDFYPNYFLRVYKKSKGQIENRWMDEHINVEGHTTISNIDVIEYNYDRQFNISGWITKHNHYATREAVEFLMAKYALSKSDTIANLSGNKTERKRWIKENIYYRIPLFTRPFLYFLYRYIIKRGFLDGKEGFVFLVLQAFWYRFLVDTKIYQIEYISKREHIDIKAVLRKFYDMDI